MRVDNTNIKSNVEDFLFKFNNNLNSLKSLAELITGSSSKPPSHSNIAQSSTTSELNLANTFPFVQIKRDLIQSLTTLENKTTIKSITSR